MKSKKVKDFEEEIKEIKNEDVKFKKVILAALEEVLEENKNVRRSSVLSERILKLVWQRVAYPNPPSYVIPFLSYHEFICRAGILKSARDYISKALRRIGCRSIELS